MQAVIFDLDGTLIDSAPDIAAVVNRVLAADGLQPLDLPTLRDMIGDGAGALLERAFAARGEKAQAQHLAAFVADYQANPVVETQLYDGLPQVLAQLRAEGRPLGICTNKPMAPTLRILDRLGLGDMFGAVVGGDSTPHRKPDPAHLAATLAGLGTDRAIMIGDHENDLRAAEGLGLPVIFAGWGYGRAAATHIAETPADLPRLIAKMA